GRRAVVSVVPPARRLTRLGVDPGDPIHQAPGLVLDGLGAEAVGVVYHVQVQHIDADVPEGAMSQGNSSESRLPLTPRGPIVRSSSPAVTTTSARRRVSPPSPYRRGRPSRRSARGPASP